MSGIIDFIMNLFFGGKKKEEVKKLDKAIKSKNIQVKELEKEVEVLQSKKRVNKKAVAKIKRKVTNTKKQILAAEEVSKTNDVDEAVKYLKKFSKQSIFIYMRYLIYILFIGLLFGQDVKTYTFTEEEVLGFTNKIKELELKDSLNVSLVGDLEKQISLLEDNSNSDSLIIDFRTQQLQLQKETINLYKEKVKVVKPKWHENKWLWFVYGVGATAISVNLAGQLAD